MPIWLRRFTFLKIKEYYDKQQEEQEKATKQLKNSSNKSPAKPNISPKTDYVAKAPTRK